MREEEDESAELARLCQGVSLGRPDCNYPATVRCTTCDKWFCDAHAEDELWYPCMLPLGGRHSEAQERAILTRLYEMLQTHRTELVRSMDQDSNSPRTRITDLPSNSSGTVLMGLAVEQFQDRLHRAKYLEVRKLSTEIKMVR